MKPSHQIETSLHKNKKRKESQDVFTVWGIIRYSDTDTLEATQDPGANSVKLRKLISTHLSLVRERAPFFQSFESLEKVKWPYITNRGWFHL